MSENIPKVIQDEFTIITKDIKYPTYPDEEFQKSILDDNIANYSEENIKKTFNDFLESFKKCKNIIYDIIGKNSQKIQDYCFELNVKTMDYIFNLFMLEKLVKLAEKKYYKMELDDSLKKELFFDDMIYDCCNKSDNFAKLYKKEYKDKNEISKLSQIFNPIIERYNKLIQSKNEIGLILVRTIKFLHKYAIKPLEEEINNFKKIENLQKDSEEKEMNLLNLLLKIKKLSNLDIGIYNAAILDKNDICNLEESSNEWENLKKIFFRIIPKNAEELKKKISQPMMNSDLSFSIMSNIHANDSSTSIIFSGLKNLVYYKANEKKSKIDSKRFQLTSSLEKTMEFVGLFKKFKIFFKKMIEGIPFRRKIYVKKEFPPINRIYIEKLINFMKGEKNPMNSEQNKSNDNIIINDSLPIIYRDKVPNKKNKRNYVSVTILNNEKLYFKDETNETMLSSFVGLFKRKGEKKQINNEFRKNTILIHIHGGGFIGSSTLIHERYLRQWSKILKLPIFGINYSLAPKYPYPEGLNDVFQTYMWILRHAKEELNMDIKHIILSGDSAGANLALGLNNILITMKEYEKDLGKTIILPELISIEYPTTYVNLKNTSNSFILSMHSQMLSITAMKFMYDKYVISYEMEDEDPFLNPIKINDFLLDRIKNKIRIYFGTQDVLRGDGVRLLNEFSKYNNRQDQKNKIDIRGYDIIYFNHGFNGFAEDIRQVGRNLIFPEIEEFLNKII